MSLVKFEVERLHQFFQDWFNGQLEQSDSGLAPFANALAEDFHMVTPKGQVVDRAGTLETVREFYGSWHDDRIWIENFIFRCQCGQVAVANYEEWQNIAGNVTRRISTAIFQVPVGGDGHLHWLHVHETLLQV